MQQKDYDIFSNLASLEKLDKKNINFHYSSNNKIVQIKNTNFRENLKQIKNNNQTTNSRNV